MNTTTVPIVPMVCVGNGISKPKGFFSGDGLFSYATPVVYLQFSIAALLTAFLQQILTPLGESAFISQMLVGIAMGPVFGAKQAPVIIRKIFPITSYNTSETFAFFGCMLYMFLVGVRMDLGIVKRSGKKAVIIGVCSFIVPMTINTILALILRSVVKMEPKLYKSVVFIASFQSLSSFHVIVCVLADLKLLDSELGRLASCSSMISGICAWVWLVFTFTGTQSLMTKDYSFVWMVFSAGFLLIILIFVLKPILKWMIRQTPDGRAIKEGYILSIFVMILGTSLFGEIIGQHFMIGPMILGLIVPDGPPLGSALVDKLETFVSCILLPGYFVISGSRMNNSLVQWRIVGLVEIFSLSAFIAKVLGAMLPALFSNMPVADAFSLGLIMSAQGINDVLILQHSLLLQLVDRGTYSCMVISIVLLTGIITPIIKILYKPSKRYRSHKNRTIQHAKANAELRMLTCIYHQDNTPSIIEFLKVSNSTPKSPICFYVVHLLELTGRSAPVLISHRPGQRNSFHSNHSDHIINAFRSYEEDNRNSVVVNLFTAISPYATMHDEICTLALDKRVCMVIVPFHKQWMPGGTEEMSKPMRSVNHNILRMAPCSVGILIDRGTLTSVNFRTSRSLLFSIGMIFVEGPDDREALAYGMRMGDQPNVGLTVIRVVEPSREGTYRVDWELDDGIINEFKIAIVGKKNHFYEEKVVSDSVEMIGVLQSLENRYDLILVGRDHSRASPLFTGLTEWNEFPELGFIGDMLVSSDSNCQVSVLVVQQDTCGSDDKTDSFRFLSEDSSAIVDMPRDPVKVWPVSSKKNTSD